MTKNGFKLMKNGSSEAIYKRKTILGYDIFGSSPTNYTPVQVLGFGVSKIIKPVETITAEVNKHVQMNPPIHINTRSLSLTNYEMNRQKDSKRRLKSETTEEDVKEYADEVVEYLQNNAIPQLEKFNDLREIDKIINGDDFWITDWQMPFNLGGNFYVKRLIVAKLAGNRKYEEVVRKNYEGSRQFLREAGNQKELDELDESDLSQPIPFTVEYLKNVPSLYE